MNDAALDRWLDHVGPKQVQALFRDSARALLRNRSPRALAGRRPSADALSAAERVALADIELPLESRPRRRRADAVSRSVTTYMALIATSYTTKQAALTLKRETSRIRQLIGERALYAIDYEGEWRIPRFQIEHGHLLPGLAKVVRALSRDLHPLAVANWFLHQHADLVPRDQTAPLSPRDWLARGLPVQAVVGLASGLQA